MNTIKIDNNLLKKVVNTAARGAMKRVGKENLIDVRFKNGEVAVLADTLEGMIMITSKYDSKAKEVSFAFGVDQRALISGLSVLGSGQIELKHDEKKSVLTLRSLESGSKKSNKNSINVLKGNKVFPKNKDQEQILLSNKGHSYEELHELLVPTNRAAKVAANGSVLSGVKLKIVEEGILGTATDGHRFHNKLLKQKLDSVFVTKPKESKIPFNDLTEEEQSKITERDIIIPSGTINTIDKVLSDNSKILIAVTENNLMLNALQGELLIAMCSTLLVGKYPNTEDIYQRAVKNSEEQFIEFQKEDLITEIENCKLMSANKSSEAIMVFRIEKDAMTAEISIKNQVNDYQACIPVVSVLKSEITLAFNVHYLVDMAAEFDETVKFFVQNENSPVVVQYSSDTEQPKNILAVVRIAAS